jgi:hypothetical protein
LTSECQNFQNLDDKCKLIWILNNEDPTILRYLCQYLLSTTIWLNGIGDLQTGWPALSMRKKIFFLASSICKRHLESMLKGIKSYLCLVQTGHVDIEEFWCIKSHFFNHREMTCTSTRPYEYISFPARVFLHHNYWYFTANIYFDVLLLCINHNCYLYMPSWGPDLVNKLILYIIGIFTWCLHIHYDDM